MKMAKERGKDAPRHCRSEANERDEANEKGRRGRAKGGRRERLRSRIKGERRKGREGEREGRNWRAIFYEITFSMLRF